MIDLSRLRVQVRTAGAPAVEAAVAPGRPVSLGGLEVLVDDASTPASGELRWSVANAGDRDVRIDAVSLVWDAGAAGDDPRLFSNGFQSWTPAHVQRLGVDTDPSRDPRPIPLVRAAFHADPGVAEPGELRSEQVAVLADGARARLGIGFVGGATHAGTIRVRVVDGRLVAAATAWLGGATLRAGARRELHPIVVAEHDDPTTLLEQWADRTGRAEHARVDAPFLSGWCSWYHYFEHVSERDMLDNLALAQDWPDGDAPAIGMFHEVWGGVMWQLDTTNPEVADHLAATAAALVAAGYRYLKLDFTFSASMPGRFADPTRTPAERVRAGYDAIRRGAGDDVFILGCGAPLGAVVGSVDAMRIGADVAPWWDAPADAPERQPAYEATTPATRHAFVNTCTRSFMHRRLCPAAAEGWALTVGASGGLVLVSDDLSLIDARGRRLLDTVVEMARAVDDAARAGSGPRALGLLDPDGPGGITGVAATKFTDVTTGESPAETRLVRRDEPGT